MLCHISPSHNIIYLSPKQGKKKKTHGFIFAMNEVYDVLKIMSNLFYTYLETAGESLWLGIDKEAKLQN